jgi:hypothetical protein
MPLHGKLNGVSDVVLWCWYSYSDAWHLLQIYTLNSCPYITPNTVYYLYVLYFRIEARIEIPLQNQETPWS